MKRQTVKKVLGTLTALAMALGMAGCGKEQEGNQNQQEQAKDSVVLEWYYRGNGIQKDTQAVEDAVNTLLKDYEGLEHVTLHMNPFAASDYANGVLLAQTSGKQIDILNTVGLNFVSEVNNGTYLALDDYLDKNPDLKQELPDWLWDLGKVDGHVYIVPNYQRGANRMYITIPKAYGKYIDVDRLRNMLVDKTTSLEDYARIMEQYLLDVREGEGKETKYLPSLADLYTVGYYGFGQFFDTLSGSFALYDGDTTVKNLYLTEEFKNACRITAEWYEKGYIPQDVLVLDMNTYVKENMLNDASLAINSDQWYGDEEFASESIGKMYGFDVYTLPFNDHYFMANSWGAGGNGVTASCQHPEEAVRFLEALTTEKGAEIYNLIVYGLEGVHYEKIDDTHIRTLEYDGPQGGSDTSYAAMKWIIGNTAHAYLNQACSDDEMRLADEINNNPDNVVSGIMGLRIDTEPVATELEQIAAVVKEYKDSLIKGVKGSDWEATYNEFVKKMDVAGVDKVLAEFQSQVDEFLK